MSRNLPLLALVALAPSLRAGDGIASMDENPFRAPKEKGKAELVEGKVGKAMRLAFDRDARSTFFISTLRGNPSSDKAAGLSFWVKGDASDSFGGRQLIWNYDFAVRYDVAFPIKEREWPKVTAAWAARSEVEAAGPAERQRPVECQRRRVRQLGTNSARRDSCRG